MKAMILAAGRGERMRPLTDITPKPLLPAGGKPLIVWMIQALARAGIAEIVINVSHLGGQIERALGDGRRWNVRIDYSREARALGTAGGIATALPLLGREPFIVANGDIYTDFDFNRLQRERLSLAHLVLVDNPSHHPAGDFGLAGSGLANEREPRYTFSGIGVYQSELFASVAAGTHHELAALLKPQIAAERVTAERYPGRWFDVGTPERLTALDQLLRG